MLQRYFKNPKNSSEIAAMQAHVQGAVDQVRSRLAIRIRRCVSARLHVPSRTRSSLLYLLKLDRHRGMSVDVVQYVVHPTETRDQRKGVSDQKQGRSRRTCSWLPAVLAGQSPQASRPRPLDSVSSRVGSSWGQTGCANDVVVHCNVNGKAFHWRPAESTTTREY